MAQLSQSFGKQIREVVAPALKEAGFAFDGSRTLRRFVPGTQYVHIINFQLGARFMQGKFTVNLAVYHPAHFAFQEEPKKVTAAHCLADHRERLGVLAQPRREALERIPFIGFLFVPRDRWWPAQDPKALEDAKAVLLSKGFSWLDTKTPNNQLQPTASGGG